MSDLVERVARALIKRQETHGIMDTPYSEMAHIALRAILETHAIVPREPTEKMLRAGWSSGTAGGLRIARNVWEPMLIAAPDPLKE
jgi:hypothetical protein